MSLKSDKDSFIEIIHVMIKRLEPKRVAWGIYMYVFILYIC